jgi:hypothetical protein
LVRINIPCRLAGTEKGLNVMTDIRSEMIEASFGAGSRDDLSRFFADELRGIAPPAQAKILSQWIDGKETDPVKASIAAAVALEQSLTAQGAPHILSRLSDSLIEFSLTSCWHPQKMTQPEWRNVLISASTALQNCADGVLTGDRATQAHLKIASNFLRCHFKDLSQ